MKSLGKSIFTLAHVEGKEILFCDNDKIFILNKP
jgi:hypothetical protein